MLSIKRVAKGKSRSAMLPYYSLSNASVKEFAPGGCPWHHDFFGSEKLHQAGRSISPLPTSHGGLYPSTCLLEPVAVLVN